MDAPIRCFDKDIWLILIKKLDWFLLTAVRSVQFNSQLVSVHYATRQHHCIAEGKM